MTAPDTRRALLDELQATTRRIPADLILDVEVRAMIGLAKAVEARIQLDARPPAPVLKLHQGGRG